MRCIVLWKDIPAFICLNRISFKSTNTIQHLIKPKTTNNIQEQNMCRIYKLTCSTCKLSYVRQTSRSLKQTYQKHIRYIKQNYPRSSYMLHILNNNHEYGPINITMTILKQITKTSLLIPCEQLYIQSYYYHKQLIPEQNAGENNPMYPLNFDPHIMSPTACTLINTPTLPLSRP